jgi:hypothetical protein
MSVLTPKLRPARRPLTFRDGVLLAVVGDPIGDRGIVESQIAARARQLEEWQGTALKRWGDAGA